MALEAQIAHAIRIAEDSTRLAARAWDEVAASYFAMVMTCEAESIEAQVAMKGGMDAKRKANRIWLCLGWTKSEPPDGDGR